MDKEQGPTDFSVLDNGYVSLVEYWGSDSRIIEAARMSTSKGFQGWGPIMCICNMTDEPGMMWEQGANGFKASLVQCKRCKGTGTVEGDEKLLKYLWDHHHTTPFEMAGMTIEVQAPIFVFREWHRHRTQSYNEMSSRYTELPDMSYMPSTERLRYAKQGTINKQGSSEDNVLTLEEIGKIHEGLEKTYHYCRESYEGLLRMGVAREVARLVLPVAQYSKMRASANLWNWLHFLGLRKHPSAQWEIQQYATAVHKILTDLFPRTLYLFDVSMEKK